MEITQSVLIESDVASVYRAFADLTRWKGILDDVLDATVLYDDGYHQEFTMTVARPAGPETVRGIRYCRPHRELELFQPQPPPGLRAMRGTWTFSQEDGGRRTRVVATRSFELAPDGRGDGSTLAGDEQAFARKLSDILSTNLHLFKKALEGNGSGHR